MKDNIKISIEDTKKSLENSLEKYNYDDFKAIINNLVINEDNYEEYLNLINDVITNKMLKEQFGGDLNSGERVLRVFNDKGEKTFFEIIPELRSYVANVFREKLNVNSDNYVDDSPISISLDNFEGRFM